MSSRLLPALLDLLGFPRMMRVELFTLTGVLFLGHWLLADPSFEMSEATTRTTYVPLFSAALLTLALALAAVGRMLGGRWALRFSFLAGAGVALRGPLMLAARLAAAAVALVLPTRTIAPVLTTP